MDLYREPIKNTCPDIDKIIQGLLGVQKIIKGYDRIEEAQYLKDIISDVENELWGFEDRIEELRSNNSTLREWGNDLVSRCKDLDKEVSELESKVSYLEGENDELEHEMYELKNRD